MTEPPPTDEPTDETPDTGTIKIADPDNPLTISARRIIIMAPEVVMLAVPPRSQ